MLSRIGVLDQDSGLAMPHRIDRSAAPAAQHGNPAGVRLDIDDAEPFDIGRGSFRGENEQVGFPIGCEDVGLVQSTREPHPIRDAEIPCQRLQARPVVAFPDDRVADVQSRAERAIGAQYPVDILPAVPGIQPRHRQQFAGRRRFRRRPGLEEFVLDTGVDDDGRSLSMPNLRRAGRGSFR